MKSEQEILAQEKEEMDAIARKHKIDKVYKAMVPVGDSPEIAIAYFRKPTRKAFSAGLALQDRDPIRAKEVILRDSFLEGDMRVLDDDETFYNACTIVDALIGQKMAYLKKN